MCENSILSEIEQLRVDGSGVRVTLEKIPPNEVSNVTFEEMRKEQAKFNGEALETLQLIRQEIKGNQEKMRVEMEKMKEEQKKVMDEVKESKRETKNENASFRREFDRVEADLRTMKEYFEAKKANEDQATDTESNYSETTSSHHSNQKISISIRIDSSRITFQMLPSDTILDLKKEIEKKENIPVDRQCIFFTGISECEDHVTLREYGIKSGSTVSVLRY